MHCSTISSKTDDLKLSIFDSIHLVNQAQWDGLVADNNVYLLSGYLKSLENTLSDTIDFRYILFYRSESAGHFEPVGVAIVQLLKFDLSDFNISDLKNRFNGLFSEKMFSKMEARVLLCGNAFSTGENGYLFCPTVDPELGKVNLSRALDRIKRDEKKSKNDVSVVLLKDFWPESFSYVKEMNHEDFIEFMIDVNMVLHFDESWKTYDDYLEAMITKFRTKAKSIYKKSEAVQSRVMNQSEIVEHIDDINQLYKNVVGLANYRFAEIKAETFAEMAKNMGNNFVFTGYFIENKMVGFSSGFKFKNIFDANFVGIDYDKNHEFAIYQRMLCDFVKLCFEHNLTELWLGRTAEEIKSCIGAEPIPMKLLIKHRNSIANKLIKPFVSKIAPSQFEIRKPFKAVYYQ
ncbi:MAG: hypothetical protein H6607_05240 [Flavobacteriales bacterium]|nr:hypothetical protein [Flavobacteriales bacterium]